MKRPPLLPRLTGKAFPAQTGPGKDGFTLSEMMVAMGITMLILLALITGAIALQRSYSATDQYANAQNSELRVMDYLMRDLRRAGFGGLSAPAYWTGSSNSPISISNSAQVSILVPDYYNAYDANGNPSTVAGINSQPNDPVLTTGTPVFGSNLVMITYYVDANTQSLVRQIDWTASGVAKTSRTVIADGVQLFQLGFVNFGSVVQATITFLPIFERNTQVMARAGTTLQAAVTLRDASL
jgi:Tfp pilus assembly protein PilW